jgi:hypothetical protein
MQNIAAQADIWLGLSAIPVLAVIYAAESAKFAGFRQKSADCARRLVRVGAYCAHSGDPVRSLNNYSERKPARARYSTRTPLGGI